MSTLQVVEECSHRISGGDIDVGDRLGSDDDPHHRGRRLRDRMHNMVWKISALAKKSGASQRNSTSPEGVAPRGDGTSWKPFSPSIRPSTASYGRHARQMKLRSARPTAMKTPRMTPTTATPRKHTIDNTNSRRRRWCRGDDAIDSTSESRRDDDCREGAEGRFLRRLAQHQQHAIPPAPTTPVTCVFAPAYSATGVRDELLLIANPWNNPAATLAAPSATSSWL